MSTFKKAKVVMLPTNEKATIGDLGLSKYVLNFAKNNDWINIYNPIKQHIYIISDDEIKEGDWFLYYNKHNQIEGIAKFIKEEGENNTLVEKYSKITGFSKFYIGTLGCKKHKIIATTDIKLGTCEYSDRYRESYFNPLPQPSKQFIQKFVEEYNRGNVITDILVEYQTKLEWTYSHSGNRIQEESNPFLKINHKDNTITIKKVKDSWNREEVIENLKTMHINLYGAGNYELQQVDKWIEENL